MPSSTMESPHALCIRDTATAVRSCPLQLPSKLVVAVWTEADHNSTAPKSATLPAQPKRPNAQGRFTQSVAHAVAL